MKFIPLARRHLDAAAALFTGTYIGARRTQTLLPARWEQPDPVLRELEALARHGSGTRQFRPVTYSLARRV